MNPNDLAAADKNRRKALKTRAERRKFFEVTPSRASDNVPFENRRSNMFIIDLRLEKEFMLSSEFF